MLPVLCQIDGEPVRLRETVHEGRKAISFDYINRETLWSELTSLAAFVRRTDRGMGARNCVPRDVASQVYGQAYRTFRNAPEVAYTPLFLEDGSLVCTPKYHYDPERPEYLNILLVDGLNMPEVPEKPTEAEVREAVEWIRIELLSDFPFLDFDGEGNERREPSEAHAFAMLLTPFMRRMIKGQTPVFFVDKPQPGTGGTLLAQLPMYLFDGEPGNITRYSQNDEEMQKQLIAAVQDRRSHLFFDDVVEFNSRELLRAITQSNISGRLLGASKTVSVPNKFNWVGTGNNTAIYAEMRRRTVFIKLNAKLPKVNERKFRHPNVSGMEFIPFIEKHRGIIVRHILTMIQYWISLGMPAFTLRRRPSFEDWGSKVGGVLQACGVNGFLDTLQVKETDADDTTNKQFVREFQGMFGVDNMQSPRDLFEWSVAADLDIITGNSDDQKRAKFLKHSLPSLHGRTYSIKGHSYMFKRTYDKDENIGYMLVKIIEDEPKAPPPSNAATDGD